MVREGRGFRCKHRPFSSYKGGGGARAAQARGGRGACAVRERARPRRVSVAIQCLETAFGVSMEDQSLAVSQTLPEIFEAVAGKELEHSRTNSDPVTPSEDDVAEAERLKTEGNDQMKAENFEAAVSFYGKAIELNPANAVYFCNRYPTASPHLDPNLLNAQNSHFLMIFFTPGSVSRFLWS
ncbi:small glutamine-rich tetratricopeptide repeat-containing protein alpha-like [Malurus melanocephalus]|uniref:small glutamine-rich tetratricopeptide repeat-containing protein alpha-like n=1 Tax=Malurus melanocephalus TaxID=175006 RepID=UPI002547982D|nr:small glutamine-rich tetratricopeptide repeat-containing protein alpha-like [Malurus melanocephalus]